MRSSAANPNTIARMQFSVYKKGWMDEEIIFLLLFIFGKSFDRTVVQREDCQNRDIIRTI